LRYKQVPYGEHGSRGFDWIDTQTGELLLRFDSRGELVYSKFDEV
jgi:hypothetical protein